jgi:hypothetical protein
MVNMKGFVQEKIKVLSCDEVRGAEENFIMQWRRIFEKLVVAQLVNKFPTFYGT